MQNVVRRGNGVTALVVATETRMAAREFRAAPSELTVARVEDAVTQGWSSLCIFRRSGRRDSGTERC